MSDFEEKLSKLRLTEPRSRLDQEIGHLFAEARRKKSFISAPIPAWACVAVAILCLAAGLLARPARINEPPLPRVHYVVEYRTSSQGSPFDWTQDPRLHESSGPREMELKTYNREEERL
jgi:hypothetical protein